MKHEIHVYFHGDDSVTRHLDRIERTLQQVLNKENQIMATFQQAFDNLSAQVKANTDAEASATAVIQGIAAQLAAVAGDPAKVKALSDQLKASADALSAAIVANTPAATPPA